MNVTDIIFDLGGVLLDLNMEGIGEACKRLGINPELFFVKAESPSPLGEVGRGLLLLFVRESQQAKPSQPIRLAR